jgi:hypothetical protein
MDDSLAAMLGDMRMGGASRGQRRPGLKPKYIKLHPKDDGMGLDDVFYEGEVFSLLSPLRFMQTK